MIDCHIHCNSMLMISKTYLRDITCTESSQCASIASTAAMHQLASLSMLILSQVTIESCGSVPSKSHTLFTILFKVNAAMPVVPVTYAGPEEACLSV